MNLSGRSAYRDELAKLIDENSQIICLEADLGGANHPVEKTKPQNYFNLGISELAGIDIAGGMAAAGLIPFFSTFASFAVLRAAESMKLTMGYMGLNVKVVAPYAGVAGAWFGTTHHCLEDLAIVKSFPGITIAAPYGEEETREVIRNAAKTFGPFYIRMGRNGAYQSLKSEIPSTSKKIIWQKKPRQESDSICLVSVGEVGTELTLQAVAEDSTLAHAHLVYLDMPNLKKVADELSAEYNCFLVVEEHRNTGGIGSSLALLLPEKEVHSLNCGMQWPIHGGEHTDVLNELGFNREALTHYINRLKNRSSNKESKVNNNNGNGSSNTY